MDVNRMILLKVYLCFFVTSDKEQLAFNKCTSYNHLENHGNQTYAYTTSLSALYKDDTWNKRRVIVRSVAH